MRTNVVSCESAAVTLLLGVLHVPQLYSLRSRGGRGGRVSRALFRESHAKGFFFFFFVRRGGKKRSSPSVSSRDETASAVERPRASPFLKRSRRRREPGEKKPFGTHPCFVAASTMAATVMPATPLCASSTYALFLMVPASYPSAMASALHATRRFLFAAPVAPVSVPSEPLLSPGLAPFRPGVPPELVVAGVVGAPGGAFAPAVALLSSSSARRRLLVAMCFGKKHAGKSSSRLEKNTLDRAQNASGKKILACLRIPRRRDSR